MPANFVNIDRDTPLLMAPDLREWVPENDLIHFVIDTVIPMKLPRLRINRRGSGSKQMPPKAMLALLIYCYSQGIFSSRKIERATWTHVAVRYLMADHHPDHATIAAFRKHNHEVFDDAFAQVLFIARDTGMLKVGRIAIDGTHMKASASKDRNVTWQRANELIAELKVRVAELRRKAEETDAAEDRGGPDDDGGNRLPEKLANKERRLAELEAARERMQERAREQALADAAKRKTAYQERKKMWEDEGRNGYAPRLPKPAPDLTTVEPDAKMQSNLTDPDSRGMCKRGGFMQGYNVQATVDVDGSMLILSARATQSSADMGQLLAGVSGIDESLGSVTAVLADAGYAKAADIEAVQGLGIDTFVAVNANDRRELDYRPLPSEEQLAKQKEKRKTELRNQTLVAQKAKLETDAGRATYRLRQQTVEPVFGTVKSGIGFREFGMRGVEGAGTETALVSLTYNVRKLAALMKLKKAG